MELTDAPELSAFYKMISKELKPKYCVVCLRTSKQRRLVQPVAFKNFSRLVKIGYPWQGEIQICNMCERQAANALRFYKSTQLASNLQTFFSKMRIKSTKNVKTYEFKEKQFTAELEEQLKTTRKSTQFLETEILLIDCSGAKMTPVDPLEDPLVVVNKSNNTKPAATKRNNSEVASTQKKASNSVNQSNNLLVTEAIVIDDDDDNSNDVNKSISSSETEKNPIEKKEGPQMIPMNRLMDHTVNPNQKYVIHPIMLANGMWSVPTFFQEPMVGLHTPLVVTGDNISNVLQQLVQNEVPKDFSNQDTTVIINNPTLPSNPVLPVNDSILPDKNTVTSESEVDSTNMAVLEAAPSKRQNPMLEQMLMSKSDEFVKRYKKQKMEEASVAKPKSDRIDWEDKIPMDVISFMDAVDPNAPSMPDPLALADPMGSISSVRSLADGTKPLSHRRRRKPNIKPIIFDTWNAFQY